MNEGVIVGDKPPLIPSGKYDLSFQYYETLKLFGGRALKLVLWFRVVTQGEYFEVILPRYYNVTGIIGKPSKEGNFKVGWKSSFVREYAALFGLPRRLDRLSMSKYKNHIIEGHTHVVQQSTTHRSIPKDVQYSVIDELIRVKRL